ncbi:YbdD/YjiX family protein, partial [Acinetobacter baumannii]
MFDTLSKAGKYLGQAAKMMIGVPDYDNYVEHMRITHPDQTPMTYEEFFRERQD